MKAVINTSKLLIVIILMAITGLHAADIFDPSTQPPGYATPIVLSTNDLEYRPATDADPNPGGGKAYRPWYEVGTYQGDIIEYDVDTLGTLTTSIDLSTSPPGNTGTNWSARVQLDAMDWDLDRKIITNNGGAQVAFRWDQLSDTQKTAIDAVTLLTAPESPILNFLRGDRSNESPAGALRERFSTLGDIMHSNPVYVGEPKRNYAFGDYGTFKLNNTNRAPRVYAGSNDGMVHAFDAVTGNEVWAFVPASAIPTINSLSNKYYVHNFYVDGPLTEADVQIGGVWKTILVGAQGAGGKGYFALDVTNPDLSSESANSGTDLKLIDETDGTTDPDQGYAFSRAAVTRMNDGNWYIIYGNGYNSDNGNAVLMMYNLETGIGRKIDTANGSAALPNGLSSPVLVDTDNNSTADVAYAGDIDGNLWKFDLTDPDPSKWDVAYAGAPLYAGIATQPITVQPDVSEHPSGVGALVFFGTGRLLTLTEVNNNDVQAVYGIWDKGTAPPSTHDLVTQTLTKTTFTAPSGSKRIRTISDNPVDWDTQTGWTIPLPAGERVLARARFRAFRLQFTSINPLVDGGENWLMEPSYSNGGPPPSVVFNLNEDTVLDDLDKSGTDVPGGLHLGTGINSQPVFVRVRQGVDSLLINNLSPPYNETCIGTCSGGLRGGHIDVDTDSPAGAAINYYSYEYKKYFSSVNGSADGLGGNSDGHEHEYDEHYGLTYVDFFNIEPRRNKTSLDVRDGVPQTLVKNLHSVQEVSKPDGSGPSIPVDKQFIVVIANADLSPGGTLTIGEKQWNAQEYQDMMVDILQNGKPLKDLDGDSLVFSIDSIKGASGTGTLRMSFDSNAIFEGGLMPTIWNCAKGLTDPYNYKVSSGQVSANIADNKHITQVPSGQANDPTPAVSGYRWRNGTLVVQLLDVSNYALQDWSFMPQDKAGNVTGGVHAKAYKKPPSKTTGALMEKGTGPGMVESGLLYEAFMFWHFGDQLTEIQNGRLPACYGPGASNWTSDANIERKGLNYGEYSKLLNGLTDTSQEIIDFAAATDAVDACLANLDTSPSSCTEAKLDKLLATLAAASTVTAEFERYVFYRHYAAGGLIPPDKLLSIDQPATTSNPPTTSTVPLVDTTMVDNETLINGLNDSAGARSWVDLTP